MSVGAVPTLAPGLHDGTTLFVFWKHNGIKWCFVDTDKLELVPLGLLASAFCLLPIFPFSFSTLLPKLLGWWVPTRCGVPKEIKSDINENNGVSCAEKAVCENKPTSLDNAASLRVFQGLRKPDRNFKVHHATSSDEDASWAVGTE